MALSLPAKADIELIVDLNHMLIQASKKPATDKRITEIKALVVRICEKIRQLPPNRISNKIFNPPLGTRAEDRNKWITEYCVKSLRDYAVENELIKIGQIIVLDDIDYEVRGIAKIWITLISTVDSSKRYLPTNSSFWLQHFDFDTSLLPVD